MSQENVAIVREVMQLLGVARDPASALRDHTQRLLELFAPDVPLDMSRRVFNPATYDGHEGLRQLGREVSAVWEEFTITPERVVSAGDHVVVVETRRGRGRGSGLEVEQRACAVWTLRDGKVVKMQTDMDMDEALKAVGLEE